MNKITTAFCQKHRSLDEVLQISKTMPLPGTPNATIITATLFCGEKAEFVASKDQLAEWLLRNRR